MAKLQKAKTTPFLYFPGKDVRNLVLNRKDPLWTIFRKVTRFSQQANTTPCLLCDQFQPLMQICRLSKHRVVDLLQVNLFN